MPLKPAGKTIARYLTDARPVSSAYNGRRRQIQQSEGLKSYWEVILHML